MNALWEFFSGPTLTSHQAGVLVALVLCPAMWCCLKLAGMIRGDDE